MKFRSRATPQVISFLSRDYMRSPVLIPFSTIPPLYFFVVLSSSLLQVWVSQSGSCFPVGKSRYRSCCNDSHWIRSEVKTFSRTSKRDAVLFSHQTFSASIYITWLNPSVTLAQAITMNKMLSGLLCIMFANSEVKDHPSVQCIIRKHWNHHSPRCDNMEACYWIRYVEI